MKPKMSPQISPWHRPRQDLVDLVITFSAGIGRTFAESEAALREAKKADKTRWFNLKFYDPSKEMLPGEPDTSATNVRPYSLLLHSLLTSGRLDDLANAMQLGADPKTGAYNTLGFQQRYAELKEKGNAEGYWIFLDGNGMHEHNAQMGQTAVDAFLAATGAALLKATRSGYERRGNPNYTARQGEKQRAEKDRRAELSGADILLYRKNDSAGDEFVIFLPMKHRPDGYHAVKQFLVRALQEVYHQQREVTKAYRAQSK